MNGRTETLRVGPDEAARLDVFLAQSLSWASRTKVQQAISEGRVSVNGSPIRRSAWRVVPGDVIAWQVAPVIPMELAPEPLPLDIVYEDRFIIVVNKPANMAVHPGAGRWSGTLVNALLHHVGAGTIPPDGRLSESGLSEWSAQPDGTVRPGIVHRLDKDTSGLLVVAKDEVTHRALQLQFEERTAERRYAGIVWGVPAPPQGSINAPIGRSARDRTKMAVRDGGRAATTTYKTVTEFGAAALIHFRLRTGRTHQIRVHAQHIGHPILGDRAYGGAEVRVGPLTTRRKAFYSNLFGVLTRQALHAQTLGFVHPATGESMQWESSLPSDIVHVLAQLARDPGYAAASP